MTVRQTLADGLLARSTGSQIAGFARRADDDQSTLRARLGRRQDNGVRNLACAQLHGRADNLRLIGKDARRQISHDERKIGRDIPGRQNFIRASGNNLGNGRFESILFRIGQGSILDEGLGFFKGGRVRRADANFLDKPHVLVGCHDRIAQIFRFRIQFGDRLLKGLRPRQNSGGINHETRHERAIKREPRACVNL